jgi:hypothetical protein
MSPSARYELARITNAVQAAEPGFPDLFASGAGLTTEQARSPSTRDRA